MNEDITPNKNIKKKSKRKKQKPETEFDRAMRKAQEEAELKEREFQLTHNPEPMVYFQNPIPIVKFQPEEKYIEANYDKWVEESKDIQLTSSESGWLFANKSFSYWD